MSKQNLSAIVNGAMGQYIDNILTENLTLKRKLDSKCEAITILNSEVENMRLDLNHQIEIIDELKKAKVTVSSPEPEPANNDSTRDQREINSLRLKLRDALGDIKALRCQQSLGKGSECEKENSDLNCKEMLVEELEKLQRAKYELECNFQSLVDEKEELISERDAYKCKLHRLNHECNVLLRGDSSNLIDLDALILENRVLQGEVLKMQEESQRCIDVAGRYRNLLKNNATKGEVPNSSTNIGSDMILTTKQVKAYLENDGAHYAGKASWQDLHSLCLTLVDRLSDKSLAFSHQKKVNRMLAARVTQLELQLLATGTQSLSSSTMLMEGLKELRDEPSNTEKLLGEASGYEERRLSDKERGDTELT